jgi:hypothetical protein
MNRNTIEVTIKIPSFALYLKTQTSKKKIKAGSTQHMELDCMHEQFDRNQMKQCSRTGGD